jgi:hypothetical protein
MEANRKDLLYDNPSVDLSLTPDGYATNLSNTIRSAFEEVKANQNVKIKIEKYYFELLLLILLILFSRPRAQHRTLLVIKSYSWTQQQYLVSQQILKNDGKARS